jgi:NADH:ubiquinone oxidoreductase subunit E
MSEFNRKDLLQLLKQSQQGKTGLSTADLEELSTDLNIPKNEIFGVASFYSFLSIKPQGKYIIRICKGLPCHLKDSEMILNYLQKELDFSPGEVSKDGRFSLELTNCIGACDLSPALLINDEMYGHLTPEKISKLIKEYT